MHDDTMSKTIQFTVIEDGSEQVISTYFGEYRSLMTLLKDKLYLDEFGECGGTGRCATCVIKITGLSGESLIKERNEPETLLKMGFEEPEIRLACQINVTEELNGAVIEIVEQDY